jgi:colanic acid biosynthesis glycosyl transferase WcaI
MTRLIVLNRYFFPDHSATSQILSDLMFHLSAKGVDVQVITSRQLYDDPERELPPAEIAGGVSIHRVSTTKFGRSGLAGRAIDYLSFYLSARRLLRRLLKPGDLVIAMTDPPLISVVAVRPARRKGAHLINWLQDVYPEVAIELGVPFLRGPLAAAISYLRDRSLGFAAVNVVVGQTMADKLTSRGIAASRVATIPNWTDDDKIVPVASADNPLRQQWGLDDKFVVGYSGNLGRAHEFDTMLGASEILRDDPRFVFLFIGGGHRLKELVTIVKSRGLDPHFRFMPYQDQTHLKDSLGVADVHWLSLKPELEGLIVPSKFYGIAAAGRPVIAVTARDGEIARLVEENRCGFVVAPGRSAELAALLKRLSVDATSIEAAGKNARAMLDAHFSRRHAFERWVDLLARIDPTSQNKFATAALRPSLEPPLTERPVTRARLSA